jgi:hypothetical protein
MTMNSIRVVEDGRAWPIADLDWSGIGEEIAQRLGISANEVVMWRAQTDPPGCPSINVEIWCTRVPDELKEET